MSLTVAPPAHKRETTRRRAPEPSITVRLQPRPAHWRRPAREVEQDRQHVQRALPAGHVRPRNAEWMLDILEQHPKFATLLRPRRQGLRAVLSAIVSVADRDTMTSRPGWAFIAAQTGCSRRSIARHLRTLREWGLLGLVASGRSAAYAPRRPDGRQEADAAVYVLACPADYADTPQPQKQPRPTTPARRIVSVHLDSAGEATVDETGTPPREAGPSPIREEFTHTRAHARDPHLSDSRPETLWPRKQGAKTKKEQKQAAAELRRWCGLALRHLSASDLASICRDFFSAGWTLADLRHALDYRPDGSPWPHDGAPTTDEPRRLRGWMRHRLAAWRTDAGLAESRSQRTLRQAAERKARVAEDRRRSEQAHAERSAADSEQKNAALESIWQKLGVNRRPSRR